MLFCWVFFSIRSPESATCYVGGIDQCVGASGELLMKFANLKEAHIRVCLITSSLISCDVMIVKYKCRLLPVTSSMWQYMCTIQTDVTEYFTSCM